MPIKFGSIHYERQGLHFCVQNLKRNYNFKEQTKTQLKGSKIIPIAIIIV